MTDREIVNTEVFETLRDIMEDEFPAVVDAFCTQANDNWPNAASALAAGEHEMLQRIAHGLKGSALSLGAEQLSDTLEALERAARSENLALSREQHSIADAKLAATLEWVNAAMA